MLRWRITSAAIILTIFAGICWLDVERPLAGIGGLWLLPLGLVITALATAEVCELVFNRPSRLHTGMLIVGNVLIVISMALPVLVDALANDSAVGRLGLPLLVFAIATCVAFGELMRNYRPGEFLSISRLGRSVLTLAYAGVLMSFLIALRLWGDNRTGCVALASMILVVKFADTGAYTFGRLIGGRLFGALRMAPVLSPKKTLEGGLGAILFGCLGSYLAFVLLGPWLVGASFHTPPWWAWLTYGIVLSVAGMFGDLAESLLKREAGAKDSSRWLPGLGGVLDIMDSLLFAAPLAYAFWAVGILAL